MLASSAPSPSTAGPAGALRRFTAAAVILAVTLSGAGMAEPANAGVLDDIGHDSPGELDRPVFPELATEPFDGPFGGQGITPVTNDTTFTLAGSPYLIADTLFVVGGAVLTIEPGVVVKMANDAMLIVQQADIFAVGTPSERITFEPENPWDRWLAVGLMWINSTAEIRYCDFRGGSRGGYPGPGGTEPLELLGLVSWWRSDMQITDCTFEDGTKHALSGYEGTGLIARNTIMDIRDEDINSDHNAVDLIDNVLFSPITDADVIDYNFSTAPALIQGNVIISGLDDGIDLDSFTGTLYNNVISNCRDKGVSMSRTSTVYDTTRVTAYNNMIDGCFMGFGITNASEATLWNNTVVNCGIGIRGYEKNGGLGGVTISGTNTLVWGCDTSVFADALSTIDLTYSNVEGVEPYPGEGNINADPMFVALDDFHLSNASPCIDAGYSAGATLRDFENDLRFDDPETANTGGGSLGGYYDIGADEFLPSSMTVRVQAAPARPSLIQVTPNPIQRTGSIRIELDSGEAVGTLRLFDVQGRHLRTWESVRGDGALTWDGTSASGEPLARGVYFLDFATLGSSERMHATVVVLR